MDTIIPLYPRRRVRPLCPDGVSGNITASDTSAWRGVHGLVTVKGNALVTGLDMRDVYARKTVLKTQTYPNIQFAIDSLNPSDVRGDTLRGTVYGQFIAYEKPRPMSARFRAWHEGGGLRVQSQFMIEAQDLINFYGLSQLTMGLGVGGMIWRELHMGVDVVLVPADGS
jgi:hypothetical protein